MDLSVQKCQYVVDFVFHKAVVHKHRYIKGGSRTLHLDIEEHCGVEPDLQLLCLILLNGLPPEQICII